MLTWKWRCLLAPLVFLWAPTVARADVDGAPDVVVYCDAALTRPAIDAARAFRASTGVPVRVFPMTGDEIRGLLTRGTRDDVVFAFARTMDDAAASMLIKPSTRTPEWRDPLVLVGTASGPDGSGTAASGPGGSGTAASGKRLAVPDPLPSAPYDGPALAARLGAARVLGAAGIPDTEFLVTDGDADIALLPASAAHDPVTPALAILGQIDAPPLTASAALGKNAASRNAGAFLTYLVSSEQAPILARDGLERIP